MAETRLTLRSLLGVLFHLLLATEVPAISNDLCITCTCSIGVSSSVVNCTAKKFARVPRIIPRKTRYLDLSNNDIRNVHAEDLHHLDVGSVLDLSDNPLICDCQLAVVVRENEFNIKGRCSYPASLSGLDVSMLNYYELGCGSQVKKRYRRANTITQCTSKDCTVITCDGVKYKLPISTHWGCCQSNIHDLRISFCTSNIGIVKCISEDFRCLNQHCIPRLWLCNRQNDCQDGSDEFGCGVCRNSSFRCKADRCVPGSRVCDTYNDCGDGTDETFCRKSNKRGWCGVNDFRCASDTCVHVSKVCDGANDCGDNSDEAGCISSTTTNCEAGWSYYKTSCYKMFTILSSWNKATASCSSYDGRLIKITSIQDEQFALNLSRATNGTSSILQIWIGLSRRNGIFYWTDGKMLGNHRPWGSGEPNNIDGQENCVSVMNITRRKWHDEDCNRKFAFICEKVAPCKQRCENGGECKATGCVCKSDWSGPDCTYKPPIIKSPSSGEREVKYGTEVTFSCQSTGVPRPVTEWLVNGKLGLERNDVTVKIGPHNSNITLRVEGTMELRCRAKNRGGMDTVVLRLIVQDGDIINVNVSVRLIHGVYNKSLEDLLSRESMVLTRKLSNAVARVYQNVSAFRGVRVQQFRPGSLIADMILRFVKVDGGDDFTSVLRDAVRSGSIVGIEVDPQHFFDEIIKACPPEFYNVTWYATPASTTSVQRCPSNAAGEGRRTCNVTGKWEYPDYSDCISADILALKHKLDRIQTLTRASPNDIRDILTSLASLTTPKMGASLMAGNIKVSTQILEEILDYNNRHAGGAVNETDNAQKFLLSASNLLSADNKRELLQLQQSNSTTTTLILVMEMFGLQVAEGLGSSKRQFGQFVTSNIVLGVEVMPDGVTGDVKFPNYSDSRIAADPLWRDFRKHYIILPRSAFSATNAPSKATRVASLVFRTLSSFLAVESAYSHVGDQFILNSEVISSTIKPAVKMIDPVITIFEQGQNASKKKPACVFWDFKLNSNGGGWSRDGCRLLSRDDDKVTCECDHLTNFAVLVDMSGSVKGHELPLRIITIVGCGISLLGLFLTLTVHFLFWRNLKSDKTVIHVNFCMALLIANILLLVGLERTEHKIVCSVIAAFLHYFFLCAVAWMLVEGLQIYISIVLVFALERKRKFFYLIGWGSPFIIVVISMGATQMKGYGGEKACWLSTDSSLIVAFIGPLLTVVLANAIIFACVLRTILTSHTMLSADEKQKARVAAKCSIVLLPLLGLTWFFGVLAIDSNTVLFLYLFAIVNSLQGFFIFLLHCLFDQQVRTAFTAWIRRRERTESAVGSRAFSLSTNTGPSKINKNRTSHQLDEILRTHSNASSISSESKREKKNRERKNLSGVKYEVPTVVT